MLEWLKELLGENYTEDIDEKASKEIGKNFVSKVNYDRLNEQKNQLEKDVKARDGQIADLSKVDVADLQETIERLKTENETSKQEKEKFIHETKVKQYVEKLALKDDVYEKHVTNMLLEKGLKFDGETLLGADDVINPFKEGHPEAFKSNEEKPHFAGNTGGSQTVALTRAEFEKLPYLEKYKIKTEQPDAYNQIKAEINGG